ncbi:hypothetical protein GCM10009716_47860 [Streptomyces sodiiphilus]|uniref:ATP-dependent RecD2 DNA helicase-like helix-hairpin-helix domain-containing protein n=1 Tax=Streptomyces sodiiphilus TaxID=226217 RepID=A0ABN2PX59_9ACTN
MTSQSQPAPAAGDPGGPQDKAAELLAAVRAVESGERPASSFFSRPEPAPAPRRAPRVSPAPPGAPVPAPAEVPELLAGAGAPPELAPAVVAALGAGAADELRADPWQLLAVENVRPEQADGFARALLGEACGPGDERRVTALAGWLMERAARAGHTALDAGALARGLARYAVPDPEEAVRTAVTSGAVLAFQHSAGTTPAAGSEEGDEEPVRMLLALEHWAAAEESLADGLMRLISTFRAPAATGDAGGGAAEPSGDSFGESAPAPDAVAPVAAERWEAAAGAAGSPSAAELIRAVAASGLVVHTGGEAARAEPAELAAAAHGLGLRACVAAHHEDGRRRAAGQAGGAEAVTVAGLLSGREGPGRDAEGVLEVDLLVVLDSPQLTVETAAALVELLPDGARLVLSGDVNVLGAAGPGQVLGDVLAAGVCPRVVSRTPDPGPLGELVSGVGIGELNEVEAPGKEIVIVPVRDPGEAVHRTVQLVTESIPRAFGVEPGTAQVITAGHGGPAGTRALNAALKQALAPGPGAFGGFDPGDRVAHSPVPGRTRAATVVAADGEGLVLQDGDERFTVPRERVEATVRHGWAITAHQAAGVRWPAVVAVVPADTGPVVDRSWICTAFSRGERHLSVVQGAGPGLARAVSQPPAGSRTTRLADLLREQAGQVPPGAPAPGGTGGA